MGNNFMNGSGSYVTAGGVQSLGGSAGSAPAYTFSGGGAVSSQPISIVGGSGISVASGAYNNSYYTVELDSKYTTDIDQMKKQIAKLQCDFQFAMMTAQDSANTLRQVRKILEVKEGESIITKACDVMGIEQPTSVLVKNQNDKESNGVYFVDLESNHIRPLDTPLQRIAKGVANAVKHELNYERAMKWLE